MSPKQKKPLPVMLVTAGTILLAAVLLAVRNTSPVSQEADYTNDAKAEPAKAPDRATRSSKNRDVAPRRGGSAPSLSASEDVAALVGDESLNDSEVVSGLRRVIEDAKRPIDERIEALEHVIHLVPDEHPEPLLAIAADGRQPNELGAHILAEALNRPPRLQGELLIRLLGRSSGDLLEEVRGELEGLVGENYGTNPADWRQSINELTDH